MPSSSDLTDPLEQTTTAATANSASSFPDSSSNSSMSHLMQNPEFNIDTENMRIKISLEFKQHNRPSASQLATQSNTDTSIPTPSSISSVTISQVRHVIYMGHVETWVM